MMQSPFTSGFYRALNIYVWAPVFRGQEPKSTIKYFQVSARPLVAETASLIEKETKVLIIPNLKHQITNKFQISNKIKSQLFGILNFGHCDLFGICVL
jgi:hypothetical protein